MVYCLQNSTLSARWVDSKNPSLITSKHQPNCVKMLLRQRYPRLQIQDDEYELTRWLPELDFGNIGMTFPDHLLDGDHDIEKGLEERLANLRPSIASLQQAVLPTEKFYDQSSCTTSSSTLTEELKHIDERLPGKKHGRVFRNLRYTIFSVYRQLNVIIVLVNLATIFVLAMTERLFRLDSSLLGTAAAVNIVAAILIRQELVINLLFSGFGKVPQSWPLRIRCWAANIYHLGGVHSGAAIAATIWFGVYNVPIIRAWKAQQQCSLANLVIAAILDSLLVSIVVSSHPYLRSKMHNLWEVVHRFAGWTAVALFWAQTLLNTEVQRHITGKSFSQQLGNSPIFWCLFVTTFSLILPWVRLKKVPVRAEPLSAHAVRLHFAYTNVPLCAAPRLSDSPLKEWHAFAAIPEPDGVGFSVLVSNAGDWTKKLIANPPKELWTRGIPARGVLHIAPIFKKLVLVATGSGIGPVISLLYARNIECRIIWSTKDPIKTFGQEIVDRVKEADPQAPIFNTSLKGSPHPDLVLEAYKLYRQSQAEAVFIVSNPRTTRKFVYGLESRGIPTFAPIFDS